MGAGSIPMKTGTGASRPNPGLACLADSDQFMLGVADLTDRTHALSPNHADLTAAQLQCNVSALFRNYLGTRPGRPTQLCALAGLELDTVHRGAQGNLPQWQRVAVSDITTRS